MWRVTFILTDGRVSAHQDFNNEEDAKQFFNCCKTNKFMKNIKLLKLREGK
jgi:hypothetical protein